MNEDIIRMAREAGWNEIGSDLWGATFDGAMSIYALSKFAELVRADEREACAKVCEEISMLYSIDIFPEDGTSIDCNSARMGRVVTKNCATTIRARGKE